MQIHKETLTVMVTLLHMKIHMKVIGEDQNDEKRKSELIPKVFFIFITSGQFWTILTRELNRKS